MDGNEVTLRGVVKRDETAEKGVLSFALVVDSGDEKRLAIVDCRTFEWADAYAKLGGFVNENDVLEIAGHLDRYTRTRAVKVGTCDCEIKTTSLYVFVDDVLNMEGQYVD